MTTLVVADLEISSELDRDARAALRGGIADLGALSGQFGLNVGPNVSNIIDDGGISIFSPKILTSVVVAPQLNLNLNTVTQTLTNLGAIVASATSSVTRS